MFYGHLKGSIVGFALACLLASSAAVAEKRYYPVTPPQPVEVGSEEFSENYASLAGLEGVRIVTSFIFGAAKKHKFKDMKTDLVPQIRKRLANVGLRMLTEAEIKTTPGQPTLTFFPAYSGPDIPKSEPKDAKSVANDNSNPKLGAANDPDHLCCRASTWASFQQSSAILRDPSRQYRFATWGHGEDTEDCDNRGSFTYDAVLKTIDKFIEDYKKAQEERKPRLVSSSTDVPAQCSQAWLMNLSVFETDKTVISESVKPILDKLAETAGRCEKYSYIIETHSDKRADAAYNRILSEARGHAIKDYLLRKNVEYGRLKTIAYGESKPLTDGTTEDDHAVNRRVVIIPKRDQS